MIDSKIRNKNMVLNRSEFPPQPVLLSPVAEEELPELSAMAEEIWPAAYGDLLAPGQIEYMLSWMYAPESLRREMGKGIRFDWITVEATRVGFLGYGPVEPGASCPLHKCYLLPGAQGRGIATAAMRELMGKLRGAGAAAVELRVNRHNHRAIAFYRRNGFECFAEDCREIGGGYVMDDFLMRRTLAD